MKIRKSRPEDLERMLRLYADARVFMAEHGNPTQWAQWLSGTGNAPGGHPGRGQLCV